MNAAEFRCLRQHLGVTVRWLAGYWGVDERTIHRWEQGQQPVSAWAAERLRDMVTDTDIHVRTLLAESPAVLTVPRDADGDLDDRPPSWHQTVAGRVAAAHPTVTITYTAPKAQALP